MSVRSFWRRPTSWHGLPPATTILQSVVLLLASHAVTASPPHRIRVNLCCNAVDIQAQSEECKRERTAAEIAACKVRDHWSCRSKALEPGYMRKSRRCTPGWPPRVPSDVGDSCGRASVWRIPHLMPRAHQKSSTSLGLLRAAVCILLQVDRPVL